MQLPKPSTLSPTQGGKPGPATGADAGADSQAHGSSSNDSGSGDAPVAPDAPTSNTGDGSDGAADATAPVNPPTKLTLQQILDALKAINPNFDPLNPKSEYNNNCGNTSSILNDVLNGSPVTEAPTGTLSTPQMEARTGLPQTAMTPQQVIDSLVAQGAGSHCVVGVDRSTGAGHWFNAYFDGTTVWTLDAQNGTMTPFPPHEPNATNWDASIHPDHVAPVPPGVDSTAPDATTPAVDGDGSPKSGQPDATGRGESTDAPTTAAPDRPWTPEMGDPVFSGADNGPGWQRVPDRVTNPIDPSYGDVRAPGESGALADPYAHPGTVPAEIAHLITDPEAPYGRDTDGTPFSRTEWEARYTNADGRPIYPGNDGGTQGSFVEYHDMDAFIADYGSLLDRMGDPSGGFLSFPGTPFEMRSLPPSNLRDAYSIYEMGSRLPQGVRIEVSEIAPAFGRDGGGLQVRILGADGTPMTVDQLVLDRVLHRTEVDGANGRYTHGTPPAAPTAAPASGTGAPDVAPEAPARTGAPETSGPEAPTPVDAASEAGQAEGGTTASRETMRSIPTAATVDEAAAVVGENAAAIEPATTQLMQELAASVDGELAGLEFRLKAPDSLARKIASDAAVDGLTPAEAASAVSDALRYTIRTDAAGYTGAVRDTLSALRTQGWGVRVKNYWLVDSNPYQGVNVALTSPTGQRVELQFHTPESLALKEGRLHTLYEQYRVSTDAEVRARLNAEMFAAAADLAVPADVASISGAEADQPHTPPVTPPSRGAAPVAPSPRGSAAEHDSDGAAHEVDEPSDAADIDALLTSIDDELASNGLLTDAPLPDDVRADIERELRIDSASDGVTPASSLSTPNSSATEGLNGRELARALRDETPTPALRVMVNQGSPGHDPIYTNVSATTLEADHIHPLVQIVDMPGFRDLTWEQMLEVVNLADNFVGLEGGSNSSKGGRTFAEWFAAGGHLGRGPVPAHIVSAWSRIGQQAEAAVQAHIDELLRG
ncbi:glycohydrolase toxin TNT-related protein [Agromyces ramosus]